MNNSICVALDDCFDLASYANCEAAHVCSVIVGSVVSFRTHSSLTRHIEKLRNDLTRKHSAVLRICKVDASAKLDPISRLSMLCDRDSHNGWQWAERSEGHSKLPRNKMKWVSQMCALDNVHFLPNSRKNALLIFCWIDHLGLVVSQHSIDRLSHIFFLDFLAKTTAIKTKTINTLSILPEDDSTDWMGYAN